MQKALIAELIRDTVRSCVIKWIQWAMKKVIAGAILALAPSIASSAVFNFEVVNPDFYYDRLSGSFNALDFNEDGIIRTDEIISFSVDADYTGGVRSARISVDDSIENSFFRVYHTIGDDLLTNATFGVRGNRPCISEINGDFDQTRDYEASYSILSGEVRFNMLGIYDGSAPWDNDACGNYSIDYSRIYTEGNVSIEQIGTAVVPLPASSLLMLTGLFGFAAFRRSRMS